MRTLRYHWAAFLLALIVGGCVALPQLVAIHSMGAAYQGVRPLLSDDEIDYLARAHETIDGHPTLGNPILVEHKDTPGVQFWVADTVLAHISLSLFGNLEQGGVFWDFVLPVFDLLATYVILYTLTRKRSAALVLSAYLVLGFFFLPLNRTPYPQLLFMLLIPIYALIRMEGVSSRRWAILATVSGGALFYIYPFWWTTWVVITSVVTALSFLLDRQSRDWLRYSSILLGTLVLGIPYAIGNYAAIKLSYYPESLTRIGIIHTHFPSGIQVVTIALATLVLYALAWKKGIIAPSRLAILMLGGSLAGAIVMNQHVITGINFQFVVHYTLPAVFLSVFALAYLSANVFERYPRSARYLLPVGAVILILYTLYALVPQMKDLATPHPSDVAAQRYGPVLRWLDANTKTDEVVYADDSLSLYVPAYTHDNVYDSFYVFNAYLPQAEVETRYLGMRYFDGPLTRETIVSREDEVFGAPYVGEWQHTQMINKVRKVLGLAPLSVERYPEAKITELIARETQLQKGSFLAALGDYEVDYLVWDTVADPSWKIKNVKGLTKLYEANGIVVYKIQN